jgi:hypothetical protein
MAKMPSPANPHHRNGLVTVETAAEPAAYVFPVTVSHQEDWTAPAFKAF